MLIAFAASLLGGFFLPWWWPAVLGIALGFWKPKSRLRIFFSAFIGTALAWGGLALVYQTGNHGLLAGRVAGIFGLSNGGWLVAVTALIGGLTAGFGTLAGVYCSAVYSMFKPRRTSAQ